MLFRSRIVGIRVYVPSVLRSHLQARNDPRLRDVKLCRGDPRDLVSRSVVEGKPVLDETRSHDEIRPGHRSDGDPVGVVGELPDPDIVLLGIERGLVLVCLILRSGHRCVVVSLSVFILLYFSPQLHKARDKKDSAQSTWRVILHQVSCLPP